MVFALEQRLVDELEALAARRGHLTVLTGAGVSAESGIPTFRGKEGYWTIGSKEYHPQEMATLSMFRSRPWDVWQWYLYRLGICTAAGPNQAHRAIAELERLFGERFVLLTQNVDGLHLRAGNSLERTYQVHGNIAFMRCARPCGPALVAVPPELARTARDVPVSQADRARLVCPSCRGMARPHVLWFDECYDETLYRFESSLAAAGSTDALLIVGTSGATTLPVRVADLVHRRGALFIDVNPDPDPFSEMACSSPRGFWLEGTGCQVVPAIARVLSDHGAPGGASGA